MKKSFMTRALAVSLSTAMAFSVPVVGNFTTAFADTAASSSAALAMSYTQKDAEVGTRMVFSLKGSQASKWKVVRAASSDKAVAAISKTTSKKVAVEAQGAGEAKISVRVQKTKDKRQKVLKIKLNITAADPTIASVEQTDAAKLVVTLSKPVESVAATDFAIAKNDEAKTAVAVKSATLDETDKTKVTIETETGMTDGQVYTVTYTAATEDKTVSTAEFTAQTATVLGLASVAQATTTKLTATFNGEVATADADKSNFSLVRDEGSKVIAIKSVAVDAKDKTKVTVETYDSLNDAKVYTLTYTAKTESGNVPSTAQFTATDGKIAALGLNKTTVTAGEAEEFKIQTLDAGNVVLNEYTVGQAPSNNLEVNVNPSGAGYMDGDKLYLPNVNDTATVSVTYHTYKYENNQETGTIANNFTITAVAADNTVAGFDYTIADAAPSWDVASYKQNARIAVDETKTAFFRFKNASGVDKTSNYTVESSDENKMVLSGNPEDGCAIYGVNPGTAYIIVRDKATNSVATTLAVTVIAKRVATRLEFDRSVLSVSTMSGIDAEIVKPTLKDQYGETMEMDDIVLTNGADVQLSSIANIKKAVDVTKAAITVSGSGLAAISQDIKVEATAKNGTKAANSFKVVASKPDSVVANWDLVINGDKDITIGNKDVTEKILKARIVGKDKKGVVTSYAAIENIKVSGLGKCKLRVGTESMTAIDKDVKSMASIVTVEIDDAEKSRTVFLKNVTAGDLKVTVKASNPDVAKNGSKEFETTVRLTDAQVDPTVTVLSKNADNNTLLTLFEDANKIKFSYNGSDLKVGDSVFIKGFDTIYSGNTYTVKAVWVDYKVGDAFLSTTIPVNTTFTNVTDLGTGVVEI